MKTLFTLLLLLTLFNSNLNAQWVQQTSGTTADLYSMSGTLGGRIWVCGAAGTVLKTTDWGVTWVNAGSSLFSGLDLYNVACIDNNTALVTGSNSTGAYVYKTSNGGANWVEVFFQAGGFINVISMNEFGQNGFMQGDPVSGRWSLWKTTNNGSTWDSAGMYLPQNGSEAGWNNSIYATGILGEYFFGTNNSRIYKTTNWGTSWTFTPTPDVNSYALWFNTSFGYGIAGGAQLMLSTNIGENWQIQSAPGTGNITGATGVKEVFWFTRQGPGIYVSTNHGQDWTIDTTIAGAQFNDMEALLVAPFDNPLSGAYYIYAIGSGGRIYILDYASSINFLSSPLPDRYSLSQNYPNPFNPSTKINFDIVRAGFVSVKVYNSLGQQVADLVNQDMTPGSYQADFDASALTSGIYFYTITAGDFVETKKMVLMK